MPASTPEAGRRQDLGGRPKKRSRHGEPQKRIRGKKGALKGLMKLPLDLVWEVLGFLDVSDLITMSNVNRTFHQLLTTGEAATSLFRNARARIGMPELAVPMTDLQYARMVYGKGCDICKHPKRGTLDTYFRAWICEPCLKTEFVLELEAQTYLEEGDLNRFTLDCSVTTRGRGYVKIRYYRKALKPFAKALDDLFPMTALTRAWRVPDLGDVEVPDPERTWSWETLRSAAVASNVDSDFVDAVMNGEHPNATTHFQSWFLARRAQLQARHTDAENISDWLDQQSRVKYAENSRKRLSRQNDLDERLGKLGFDEEELAHRDLMSHRLYQSTRPLSERTYLTKVEPVLRKVLEGTRRQSNIDRLIEPYDYLCSQMSPVDQDYCPPFEVFTQFDELSSIVNDVSRRPISSASFVLPASIKLAAIAKLKAIVRDRKERLIRAVAMAHAELGARLACKPPKKEGEGEYSPTMFTPVDKLPLSLPALPRWIPRTDKEPITASDEKITTFLEESPLAAHFECFECHDAFNVRNLFKHLSSTNDCQFRKPDANEGSSNPWRRVRRRVREVKPDDWFRVVHDHEDGEGTDPSRPRALALIDADVLQLSLRLQQAIKATRRRRSHDDKVVLRCDCDQDHEIHHLHMAQTKGGIDATMMYQHIRGTLHRRNGPEHSTIDRPLQHSVHYVKTIVFTSYDFGAETYGRSSALTLLINAGCLSAARAAEPANEAGDLSKTCTVM